MGGGKREMNLKINDNQYNQEKYKGDSSNHCSLLVKNQHFWIAYNMYYMKSNSDFNPFLATKPFQLLQKPHIIIGFTSFIHSKCANNNSFFPMKFLDSAHSLQIMQHEKE